MIQIIIKYGRPIVLAIKKSGSTPPILSWIWGTITGTNWGTSSPGKLWGVPESATVAVNTSPPSISGTAVVGQTLTATPGVWTGIATVNGNWQRNGVDIVGAKLLNYTLVQADAGNTSNISYIETATNTAGSANATSNALTILATLIDVYPNAAAAYSVRLLRGAYYGSPAIRVRRSNDNAEQNIGFTASGNLDTSALTTFVGANSGFITTWYDQTTGAAHFATTTPTRQPRIINAGILQTLNGKPLIRQVDSTTGMLSTFNPNGGTVNKQLLIVLKRNAGTLGCIFGSNNAGLGVSDFYVISISGSSATPITSNVIISSQRRNNNTWTPVTRGDAYTDLANQSIISTNSVFNFGDNQLALGYRFESNSSVPMHDMQEVVIYNTQTDTAGKETNLNNYYGAY